MTPDEVQNEIDEFNEEMKNTVNPSLTIISSIYRRESQKLKNIIKNPVSSS